jgi:HEAT repeat protein/predicted small lipoprotein YifL
MNFHMKSCFRRGVLLAILAATLAGCGNRETRNALQAAKVLEDQKQYQDADDVLVAALRAREAEIRAKLPAPTDSLGVDDLTKQVQADPEILKMERAQIPIYLHLQRPDLASAVYSDILGGDPDDTVVFETLQDKDPAIRTGAVRVLGLAGQPAAIGALAKASKDSDQDVRRAAVAALGTIKDPKTVPPLLDALKDSYWFVRSDAADALGGENDARAIEPLLGMIGDSDKTVQSSAENALVMLSTTKGISGDAFAARLNDPNPKVVTVAAVCLAVQKDGRATPVLLKLAASQDADARLHAVKALGEMGDASVIPTLRQLLHDPEINVRGWSIIGLGKLNDLTSVPALRAIAADNNESANIRAAASAAVDHITGTPSSAAENEPPGP